MNWKQKAARGAESFFPICYFHDVKSGDMKYPDFHFYGLRRQHFISELTGTVLRRYFLMKYGHCLCFGVAMHLEGFKHGLKISDFPDLNLHLESQVHI